MCTSQPERQDSILDKFIFFLKSLYKLLKHLTNTTLSINSFNNRIRLQHEILRPIHSTNMA